MNKVKIDGLKVAILATDGFEQSELFEPKEALEKAGAEVSIVSVKAGEIKGWKHTDWGKSIAVDELVSEANPADFDALIIPGGFGAAKNLCDFAVKGSDMTVRPDVLAFARGMHAAGKPVGLVCIAPAMAAKIGGEGTRYTIGNDPGTAAAIDAMGGRHVACAVDDCVVDRARKIVTTPAYMYPARIREARAGIRKLVEAVLSMA